MSGHYTTGMSPRREKVRMRCTACPWHAMRSADLKTCPKCHGPVARDQ